jgi:hypothetical protein
MCLLFEKLSGSTGLNEMPADLVKELLARRLSGGNIQNDAFRGIDSRP